MQKAVKRFRTSFSSFELFISFFLLRNFLELLVYLGKGLYLRFFINFTSVFLKIAIEHCFTGKSFWFFLLFNGLGKVLLYYGRGSYVANLIWCLNYWFINWSGLYLLFRFVLEPRKGSPCSILKDPCAWFNDSVVQNFTSNVQCLSSFCPLKAIQVRLVYFFAFLDCCLGEIICIIFHCIVAFESIFNKCRSILSSFWF